MKTFLDGVATSIGITDIRTSGGGHEVVLMVVMSAIKEIMIIIERTGGVEVT